MGKKVMWFNKKIKLFGYNIRLENIIYGSISSILLILFWISMLEQVWYDIEQIFDSRKISDYIALSMLILAIVPIFVMAIRTYFTKKKKEAIIIFIIFTLAVTVSGFISTYEEPFLSLIFIILATVIVPLSVVLFIAICNLDLLYKKFK